MYYNPPEESIRQVMKDTGMEYLQAIRHLQQRRELQMRQRANPQPTMGKSCYDDDGNETS